MKKLSILLALLLMLAACNSNADVETEVDGDDSMMEESHDDSDSMEEEDDDAAMEMEDDDSSVSVEVDATVEATTDGYTMAQVAEHGNASSCWSAVDGKVYDLTSWISEHPGGAANILKICGKDGSAAFNGQHGGNAGAKAELAGHVIGDLK